MYREKERRWIGPVEIVKLEDKSVLVSDTTKVVKFNIGQIIPIKTKHTAEDEGLDTIFRYSDHVEEERQNDIEIFLTEILENKNHRTSSKLAREAVRKELEGLYSKGVFEEVHRRDLPKVAVVVPSKFVHATKMSARERRSTKPDSHLAGIEIERNNS